MITNLAPSERVVEKVGPVHNIKTTSVINRVEHNHRGCMSVVCMRLDYFVLDSINFLLRKYVSE